MKKEIQYQKWIGQNYKDYIIDGELDCTLLAEACQDHFGISTEFGNTEDEQFIFEYAVDFYNEL